MKDRATENHEEYAIVLIDGVCHLCQGLTQFIIKRDPAGAFRFASLQSEIGQELLRQGGLDGDSPETMVLIEQGRYYTRSTGALRIARRLRFPWPLSYVLILIPLSYGTWYTAGWRRTVTGGLGNPVNAWSRRRIFGAGFILIPLCFNDDALPCPLGMSEFPPPGRQARPRSVCRRRTVSGE